MTIKAARKNSNIQRSERREGAGEKEKKQQTNRKRDQIYK